jgi:hypothetical protein
VAGGDCGDCGAGGGAARRVTRAASWARALAASRLVTAVRLGRTADLSSVGGRREVSRGGDGFWRVPARRGARIGSLGAVVHTVFDSSSCAPLLAPTRSLP